jgi:4-phospho-D-threonate 3-dehydrogenase / 4-phospho-D-erythronate 3-dehydrogenase
MKTIAVTMGDPAGVGPEICLRFLAEPDKHGEARPLIYGDLRVLDAAAEEMGLPKADPALVKDLRQIGMDDFGICEVSAAAGAAAYHYIIEAIADALSGEVAGVCTGPINKEALHAAGIHYPGHTEIFADKMNAERSCMLQVSDAVTASFVTCHCGHDEVSSLMTTERILEVIELTADAIKKIRGKKPLLACCGLNPHAGEHGLFGNREEERLIVPALEEARARGIWIEGPLPPDTVFIPKNRAKFDGVICMYHDQGHIPLKALAFDSAVNTTLGLPLIRTSVDHGTAFDIAWKGEADPGSLFAAFQLAGRLA